jgi:ribosomal protein S12 methylthiotransferase accessory factor
MLFEGTPFAQRAFSNRDALAGRAVDSFLGFIEQKLGVTIMYDTRKIPFGRVDLVEQFRLVEELKRTGVIKSLYPAQNIPDEPPQSLWHAACGGHETNTPVGGCAWKDDAGALMATLAEGLERYIWWEERDYFVSPLRATYSDIQKHGPAIAPERFAAFSPEQRKETPRRKIESSSKFLWIRGTSLVSRKPTYLPAQTVSALHDPEIFRGEPLIRHSNTTGLATWPTQAGARLGGALEVIEREAYMIMWLNQLILPRISLESVRTRSASLSEFIDTCERYRLKVHTIKLLTDAPTHAVCVVLEDESSMAPRYSFGLKAHRSLPYAIEKAMVEALRARRWYRHQSNEGKMWDIAVPARRVGHLDRILYWGVAEHAKNLAFTIAGEIRDTTPAPWENDTVEEHLERVVEWCRTSGYECVSVSLGTSKKNPTPWSVEMVVMPELQPTYLEERAQQLGGERWKSVPRYFGITPRSTPFSDTPHPFA